MISDVMMFMWCHCDRKEQKDMKKFQIEKIVIFQTEIEIYLYQMVWLMDYKSKWQQGLKV